MTLIEIILLSVSLCFDTFAVSVSSGICLPEIPRLSFLRIVLTFALFQTLFTVIGWFAGKSFISLISTFDHWIAFVLLVYIGIKMIYESFGREKEVCTDLRNFKILITSAVATSIDAIAAGVSIALIGLSQSDVLITFSLIAFFTAIASTLGIKGGRRIGSRIGVCSGAVGGVILVLLGFKILGEHLNIL